MKCLKLFLTGRIWTTAMTIVRLALSQLTEETMATYNSSDKLRLMIQEIECEPGINQDGDKPAMVSAVLRVIQGSELHYREEMRAGLSTMTLSAEGRWDSSHWQLCMVGCIGPPSALSHGYNSRITLYFPLTFNIRQRSIVLGTISSIDRSDSHAPLMFQSPTTPQGFMQMHQCCRNLNWSYACSKLMQAREFQMRSKPSYSGIDWRKAFFRYPASKGDSIASFSSLADELSVEVEAVPQTLTDSQAPKARIELVLQSMGSIFGHYGPRSYEEKLEFDKAFGSSCCTYKEIEISGELIVTGSQFYNGTLLFEGLYDPTVGRMHLIGCRNVEEFQDCLIEIRVEYFSENTIRLLNPKIKFSFYSKWSREDPLYVRPVSTNTLLLPHRKMQDYGKALFRKGFEDRLRILLPAMAILCIRGIFLLEKPGTPLGLYVFSHAWTPHYWLQHPIDHG
ncbi:hypothetical protein ACH5RR_004257 [Cinchona calisaya]|uniref:DUF2921 domain-containing protein n=1 Tax=Cinchona calisaya TaxID=153742 RepID=A0ABD3AX67_9GENT